MDNFAGQSVLIIEDTSALAMVYAGQLEAAGLKADIAETGADALELIDRNSYTLALLDLQLPDIDGIELITSLKAGAPGMGIVISTSDASINRAVEAMRFGAYDYMVKPFSERRLLTTVSNALERSELKKQVAEISKVTRRDGFYGFIGSSPMMQAVYRSIENVAQSKATVFVTGESGTGKEVCARAIHNASPRAGKPFVAINCGAIPRDLIESEIFGHLKGSFTGAISDRPGATRAADGGTLFLDEICEMDVDLQTKLLRFLQTSKVQPVGSSKAISVDIRVICATNRDPAVEVEAGRFREDLYYRLNVIPIHLPPLRERGGDVMEIARHFLADFGREEQKEFDDFALDGIAMLTAFPWPGNIRQLQNVIRRLAVMHPGGSISVEDLAVAIGKQVGQGRPSTDDAAISPFAMRETASHSAGWQELVGKPLRDIERIVIEATIAACDGSIPKAAEQLDISPSTIYRKKEGWDEAAA